jgi:uncharacterized membrane protein YfcA
MFNSGFLIAAIVSSVAGFMRGFVGVGSGMLMAPIFAIIFGPIDTVAIIIMMELAVTIQLLPGVKKHIEWRVIIPMGIAAVLFMPLGRWLLININADLMSRVIAWVVLVFVILLLRGWKYEGRKRLGTTIVVGALSGIMIAATSLGNPPVILYLLSSRTDYAVTNRANFTGYFAITLVALFCLMFATNMITGSDVLHASMLLPLFMLSAWLGSRYFKKSSEKTYRNVALTLLFGVAVYGILR